MAQSLSRKNKLENHLKISLSKLLAKVK